MAKATTMSVVRANAARFVPILVALGLGSLLLCTVLLGEPDTPEGNGALPAGRGTAPWSGHELTAARWPDPLLTNGLLLNGTWLFADLAAAPLTEEALSTTIRANPSLAQALKYLYECAQQPGQSILIEPPGEEPYRIEGRQGLAPEWATGSCNEACQEWVSSCMLARINRFTIPVLISIRAASEIVPPLDLQEQLDWPVQEGAFYGNLFIDPPRIYACRGSGYDPFFLTLRACIQPGSPCGIQVVGPCGAVDGATGRQTDQHACKGWDASHGSFLECRNRLTRPGTDEWPEPSRGYTRAVTVYHRTGPFGPAGGPSCEPDAGAGSDVAVRPDAGPDPDAGPGPDAGTAKPGGSVAGAWCTTDEDCADEVLFCDVRGPVRVCTAGCQEATMGGDPGRVAEEIACGGPGRTCLAYSDGAARTTFCTSACDPGAAAGEAGSCPRGQVCTGFWYTHGSGTPDAPPGCHRFCSTDSDCPDGLHCAWRSGVCQDTLPVEEQTAAADGEPCTVADGNGDGRPDIPCRGTCWTTEPDGISGTCGSLLNLGVRAGCPDDPARVRPLSRPGDGLGLCLASLCAKDGDCTRPHVCRQGYCSYPACADADGMGLGEPEARAAEEASCGGPGTTCVAFGEGAGQTTYCATACDPEAALEEAGACSRDQVCTGWWYTHDQLRPDAPGCYGFCSADADCPAELGHCATRVGACVSNLPPEDPAARPDGEPCTRADADGDGRPDDTCRGLCMVIEPDGESGICSSLINTAVHPACPDDPEFVQPMTRPGDRLGLCMYRSCWQDGDCAAPLVCRDASRGRSGVCRYSRS